MTDQKNASTNQKDPSPMDAERRRRMREAAEAAAREAPGEWCTGKKGPPFFRGFSAVACEVEDEHGLEHRILLTYNHHFEYEACARFAVETQPSAVLALLDALDQAERERNELREKLAAAEGRVSELARQTAPPDGEAAPDSERYAPDVEYEDRGSGETRRIVRREVYRP